MKLIQTQEQKLQQVQRLSQQQMLQVHLLEMPLTELEQSVNAELDDNPALETTSPEDVFEGVHVEGNDSTASYGDNSQSASGGEGSSDNDDFDARNEREERDSALNDALERIGGGDDDMPTAGYTGGSGADSADYEEMVYGDTTSFYDKLKEQMGETELSEKDEEIMEYVIGSLDSDGLLRKDSESISDELAIYHGIDCTTDDVDRVVRILQTFDPRRHWCPHIAGMSAAANQATPQRFAQTYDAEGDNRLFRRVYQEAFRQDTLCIGCRYRHRRTRYG